MLLKELEKLKLNIMLNGEEAKLLIIIYNIKV